MSFLTDKNKKIISIFPGSRLSEINILLPILIKFIDLMSQKYNNFSGQYIWNTYTACVVSIFVKCSDSYSDWRNRSRMSQSFQRFSQNINRAPLSQSKWGCAVRSFWSNPQSVVPRKKMGPFFFARTKLSAIYIYTFASYIYMSTDNGRWFSRNDACTGKPVNKQWQMTFAPSLVLG